MKVYAAPRARSRAGFTLVELTVSAAILTLVLGSVGLFQLRSQEHTGSMLVNERAETQARRALTRIVDELRGVSAAFLVPDPTSVLGTSTLTYQRPADVTNTGVVVWGPPSRLALELEPGELDNGLDDDGDGLVDERRLVLTLGLGTAAERSVVICTGIAEFAEGEAGNGADDNGNGLVDEPGFSVRRVGDLLTIRLTVLVPLDGGGVLTRSTETSLVLRN
ncbi:MAG: prepilin-type N-terminal cleavage/methylation domain-containing protein [Planctomycetes bacterium]|nr:prepilin-type N-terminal cleavage/methylation domain-containing protein [Planctomycetota bacterium]